MTNVTSIDTWNSFIDRIIYKNFDELKELDLRKLKGGLILQDREGRICTTKCESFLQAENGEAVVTRNEIDRSFRSLERFFNEICDNLKSEARELILIKAQLDYIPPELDPDYMHPLED